MLKLAFAPMFNRPRKSDATGAFQPEAALFLKVADSMLPGTGRGEVVMIDNRGSPDSMRNAVLEEIRKSQPAVVGFFCHGVVQRIQFGFDVQNVSELAAVLAEGGQDVIVPLYTCNTGMASLLERFRPIGGDGGFADALRDALCRAGATTCRVDAHTTAGHTTQNPYVRRFEGLGSPVGGIGGYMIVSPKDRVLWPRWRRALETSDLRHRYPLLGVGTIHSLLLAS